jgi:hypothetical protein
MLKLSKQFFIYGSLILLAGCADYTASSLSSLGQSEAIYSSHNSSVLAAWKIFNKQDCNTYLGRDVIAEGYVPVQMTITNNSSDPMFLSTGNFNIPLAPTQQVADKVHTSTAGRVAAWGAGGLIVWPLLIPAVYDGIKSSEANKALDEDYHSKTLTECTIRSRSSFNGVVFIPKEQIDNPIEMFLVNERTQEKIAFSVVK